MRRDLLQQRLWEKTAQERTIQLDHVRQIQIQRIANRLLNGGMISSHGENAVPAQKVKVFLPATIIKGSAFCTNVDLIESGYPQDFDQHWIQIPGVQIIIFPHSGGNEVL